MILTAAIWWKISGSILENVASDETNTSEKIAQLGAGFNESV